MTTYNLQRRFSGFKFIPTPFFDDAGENLLYLEEPQWVPDNSADSCYRCKKNFACTRRRHHCRRCGNVFCAPCSNITMPLRRMYFFDPVRHCRTCAEVSRPEVAFFADKLRILSYGASFEGLLPIATTPTQMGARQLFAYLSECNRFLFVEQKDVTGLGRKLEMKIKLGDIKTAKFTINSHLKGSEQVEYICGVQFTFAKPSDDEQRISMAPSRLYGAETGETACEWLQAFRQALEFVSEHLSPERPINITQEVQERQSTSSERVSTTAFTFDQRLSASS